MFAREDPRLLRLFPVHPEDVHLVVEEHLELLEGDHRAGLHLHPFDLQGTYIAMQYIARNFKFLSGLRKQCI